jgi:hypothetical protein
MLKYKYDKFALLLLKGKIMNVQKIRSICRPFRIVLGSALIAYGIYSGINWFYLGVIPLIAGLVNFCPLCKITGQCDILPKK